MADLDQKLTALRDLHLHTAGWLSDPAAWLGLAVGAGVATFVSGRTLGRRRSLRREAITALEGTRALPPIERLVAQATLLRRLARSCGTPGSIALQGDAWLAALDRLFQTTFFTCGAGRCFADELYIRSTPDLDFTITETLRTLLTRFRG